MAVPHVVSAKRVLRLRGCASPRVRGVLKFRVLLTAGAGSHVCCYCRSEGRRPRLVPLTPLAVWRKGRNVTTAWPGTLAWLRLSAEKATTTRAPSDSAPRFCGGPICRGFTLSYLVDRFSLSHTPLKSTLSIFFFRSLSFSFDVPPPL